MSSGTVANRLNLEVIEAAYERWRQDPEAVDLSWRFFFEGVRVRRRSIGRRAAFAPDGSTLTRRRWK